MKKALLTLALVTVSAIAARADTIADWTFETSIPATAGPFSPEIGAGSALGLHAGAATYSSPAGNGSLHSFSANTWAVGDYWQFTINASTYSSLVLDWDQVGSNTGPRDFRLAYSTDGTTFTDFTTYSVIVSGFSSGSTNTAAHHTADLSAITALNGQPTVVFRLFDNGTTAINNTGTVAAGGTDRVDNFTVTGVSAIPEPSVIGMIGFGTVLVIGAIRRRRNS